MGSPDETDELELDVEVARLRAALHDDSAVPLGMVSRLQAAVAREAAGDAPLGWEPRFVVACLAYVAFGSGAPAAAPAGVVPITAGIAIVYACLASWPVRRARPARPPA